MKIISYEKLNIEQ